MLQALGIESVDELFANIPASLRVQGSLRLPPGLSEMEAERLISSLAARNASSDRYISFLGAGAYDHFIPAAVHHITGRAEFYTSYTPYQPEVSQGNLQSFYEYQSMICTLTGMDVTNASMYDVGSAAAEACFMARDITRRQVIVVSETVHPEVRQVINTYMAAPGVEVVAVPQVDGVTDLDHLRDALQRYDVAGVVVQHPNFFGCLEPVDEIGEIVHAHGALFIASVDPISLGILRSPGDYGADIAVGDGQALGMSLSFGGPYLGFLAAREALLRRMPGRIVGATVDGQGRRGFVLTLQAREQHIRRERATSNICSNHALNALTAAVYLSLMGPEGLREVADLCLQKSHYARELIVNIPGFEGSFWSPFFKEFAIHTPVPATEVVRYCAQHGVLAGVPLGRFVPGMDDHLLVAVTEKRTRDDIERLANLLGEVGAHV